ncbi:hypothetical protein [Nonomuraea sp. NPDC049709]|uniref:hypothetical protein n=1 Tax=Nonomuraea sp. NPDC049709 TaxID=3154736 RepID=UPI00344AF89C
MFKRRLAVLGAVAVLAITGLAGSAMADEPAPTAGSKAVCTTSDGTTIELTEALPAKKGIVVKRDGKVTVEPDGTPSEAVKVEALPEGVEPGEIKKHVLEPGDKAEAVPALPALPAEPGDMVQFGDGQAPPEGLAKTVKIICKKPE